jgi:predicted ATPase
VVAKLLDVDEIDLEESLARIAKSHRLIDIQSEEELPNGTLTTRYRFSHALYQNFLYSDLVNKRRVRLHPQAGEQLLSHYGKRAPQIATQLALHFEQGRDFPRAIEYLIHAGDHAAKLYGYAEAEEHYTRALNLIEKLPDGEQAAQFATLYHKRGTVNHALSNFTQAAKDFAAMLDQARVLNSLELQSTALNALTMTLFFLASSRRDGCTRERSARSRRASRQRKAQGRHDLFCTTRTGLQCRDVITCLRRKRIR